MIENSNEPFSYNTINDPTGNNSIVLSVYRSDSTVEVKRIKYILKSDIKPVVYDYRVVKSFPHDDYAYTQGLIYENGYLLESTGQNGRSSIRKVDIASGNPLIIHNLADKYFGEGIAIFNNNVYQLTYKNRKGFIYKKESLDLVREFNYMIAQGWGLTSDDEQLFMSDGSHLIYLIEPEGFTLKGQLEVYDFHGMVKQLNELELIGDKIFANVYGKTRIVVIDSKTGKVTGEFDLKKLMPKGFEENYNKVLNGIAYNPENNHLFVTGKEWPVLYEIELLNYFNP